MKTSEGIAKISKAIVDFQAEITNPARTADNPFFKSKYTPLADLIDHVKPVMAKNGLAVIQSCGEGATGDTAVFTRLIHNSGEWIESDPVVVAAGKNKEGEVTPQAVGAAITYARRYGLAAILGVASEEDDDGNAASGVSKPAKKETKTITAPAKAPAPETEPEPTNWIEHPTDTSGDLGVTTVSPPPEPQKTLYTKPETPKEDLPVKTWRDDPANPESKGEYFPSMKCTECGEFGYGHFDTGKCYKCQYKNHVEAK